MPYSKTTWIHGVTPVDETNMNKLETQYDEAITDSPVTIRKNTGINVGRRKRLNFIEGSNITITTVDDSVNEEIDITIASTGGVAKMLYLADETEVSVAGTTETERKFARILYHANALQPTTIRVFAEMKVSAASTGTVRVYIGGILRITLTTTNTALSINGRSTSR